MTSSDRYNSTASHSAGETIYRNVTYLRSFIDDLVTVISPLLEVADGVIVYGEQVAEESVDVTVPSVFVPRLYGVEIHFCRNDLPVVCNLERERNNDTYSTRKTK